VVDPVSMDPMEPWGRPAAGPGRATPQSGGSQGGEIAVRLAQPPSRRANHGIVDMFDAITHPTEAMTTLSFRDPVENSSPSTTLNG